MVVFDLREEAQLMSWMYLVALITVLLVLAAMTPFSVRARLPLVLPEDVRPLALFFVVLLIYMVWYEDYERRQADATVERCLNGGCSLIEGRVSGVVPVEKVTSGGRVSQTSYRGATSESEKNTSVINREIPPTTARPIAFKTAMWSASTVLERCWF
jgi:hypothetical protein